MPALPKPHRVAFLVPEVKIEGVDAAYEKEAAALIWNACIEVCQRHPRLSVLDADATPLFPQDGHFAPEHAGRGGTPIDPFYGPTRRDEVAWLELTLGKPAPVRLRVLGRDGKEETFDALGRSVGEQIQQVLASWLSARGLGSMPRRFDPVSSEELIAVVRVIAPTLVEQARAWSLPVASKPTWSLAVVEDEDDDHDPDDEPDLEDAIDAAIDSTIDSTFDLEPSEAPVPERRKLIARPLVARLPQAFRLHALRLLELALREDLAEPILAVDPEHPQALLARFDKTKDLALLRRVIASAPGLARVYELLHGDEVTHLEEVAAAGMAALCRPASLEVIETAADLLADHGRTDEGLRLVERAAALHREDPRAHLALLDIHEQTSRPGAWLDQALRSASQHGCPMDPGLPWYPDQIHVELRASTALLEVGRLDEAIALRKNRLDGRESQWPHHTRVLTSWRKDPRYVAWSYAREGFFRGDEARAVEGFGRVEPGDSADLAIFLDSLVALGREEDVALAWAQYGLGRGYDRPVARLAASRALMAAGEWRRGIEELLRAELTEPGRDEHAALVRCALVMSAAPIDVVEAALAERIAIGAPTLARRMARNAADYVPLAAKSGLVARALGKPQLVEFDPAWLSGFSAETPSRRAIDALFAELGPLRKGPPSGFDIADELARGDRLVNRWLEVAFAQASEDDRAALAQAAAYTAAQALSRYLAATTAVPTTIAGALRTVAGEALALVRRHRQALGDREARAVLAAIDPLLRRIDRWIGATWLGAVERALGIDERTAGDVFGFARECPTVAARILGPEEAAVLAWTIARLHRERPEGWAAKVAAQASRLASHTGYAGADEWADAVAAQLAAREIELDDAIDALHCACYLADGVTAGPHVHAARVLFTAGRAPAAVAVLTSGMRAADPAWRDEQLASLRELWQGSNVDVPHEFEKVATGVFEALQKGDPARAEKLGRWAVAYDPGNAEAHRNLGLALAQQGKVVDAMHHLVRGTHEQATQILSGALYQTGKLPEALAVLDYASRWYVRADQWLTYAGIAYEADDKVRTARAYARAYQLDPDAFDATQLSAYAGALEQVGDAADRSMIADHLLRVGGSNPAWKALAERLKATSDRATPATAAAATGRPRLPIHQQMEAGDLAGAASQLAQGPWRARRAALHAARFRFASENQVEVTPRARAAAATILADTVGTMDREALAARALALRIRENAYFPRDPVPRLGDRMTREVFYAEFRARGGVVLGDDAPAPVAFVDRVVVPNSKIARASDYIALLRDLAAMEPKEALAQFDLDEPGYLEVARAWAAAMDHDASIAATINAGLAKR
jgi:hypothetical protein